MASEKRKRQDAGRLIRLEQEQQDQKRSQRGRQLKGLGLLVGVVVAIAIGISVFGGDDGKDEVSTDSTSTTVADDGSTTAPGDTSTTEGAGEPVAVVLPGAGETITGDTPCPEADGSSKRTTGFEQAPPSCVTDGATYTATIETSEGDIVLALDSEAAPETVNNFVVLARYHFYDNVPFHRIIPGFMNQAGDPVGPEPGTGGPGYTIADELPTGADPYPAGTLAMANTGQPDSGGSQWFITVEGGGAQLSPSYTAFGHVTEGQDVVDAINQHGDAATNGKPTKVITIKTITITES
jgi:cyclophilin family peptidyl-prolyl cis-trans isomerase